MSPSLNRLPGRLRALALAAVLAGAAAAPVHAQGTALALRVGTFGPSAGLVQSLSRRVSLRLDVPYLSYSRSDVVTAGDYDLNVDSDIRFLSFAGLLEVHPFGNALRLSAGAIVNKTHGTFTIGAAEPLTISGSTYSVSDIGQLEGRVEMGTTVAPYVGLGLGNPVGPGKRLGVSFDVGAMFSGAPSYTMTGTGLIAPTASEAPKIEANLDWVRFYPGVSLGLTYKIF